MTSRIALVALALSTALAAPASAQSYTAPAGIPAATAPGGIEGRAALPNLIDARGDSRQLAPRGISEDGLVTGSVRGSRGAIDRFGR